MIIYRQITFRILSTLVFGIRGKSAELKLLDFVRNFKTKQIKYWQSDFNDSDLCDTRIHKGHTQKVIKSVYSVSFQFSTMSFYWSYNSILWLGIFALFIVLFNLVDQLSGNREKKKRPKRQWGLFGYVKYNWWINLSLRWTDADCFRLLVKLGVLELQRGDDAEPQACTFRGQIILVGFFWCQLFICLDQLTKKRWTYLLLNVFYILR